MKHNEFPRWVEQARELNATHLEVRRARQSGGTTPTIFLREKLEGLDVERVVERMREDIVRPHRRVSKATFDVLALRVDGKDSVEVARDGVVISRDDVDDQAVAGAEVTTVEGASVEMQRAAFNAAREAHRDLRDMAVSQGATLLAVVENLSTKLVESQQKVAEVLTVAFEFSTLQREREQDERASSERRQLGTTAIQEFAPLLGAGLAHVMRNATPAWAGFAQRLQTSGKLKRVLEVIDDDPEIMAALGSALGLTFPDKATKEGKPDVEAAR